jgi:hypothetical protein
MTNVDPWVKHLETSDKFVSIAKIDDIIGLDSEE